MDEKMDEKMKWLQLSVLFNGNAEKVLSLSEKYLDEGFKQKDVNPEMSCEFLKLADAFSNAAAIYSRLSTLAMEKIK